MKRIFLIFLLIFLISCQTQIKYRTVPLTTPPEKYYIDFYTTKKTLYLEYQSALIKIAEWQLWYNLNARTNYYYYDITNIQGLRITNEIINNYTNNMTNEFK